MFNDLLPVGRFTVEEFLIEFGERSQLQKEVVAINDWGWQSSLERNVRLRRLWRAPARAKVGVEPEVRRQHKRTVVVNIIVDVVVRRRRLWRRAFQGWMRINQACGDVKA